MPLPILLRGLHNASLYPSKTNLARAWSLKKVVPDYEGYCVVVRRSSDDALQNIGFDENGNVDEAAILSFCNGSTGYVHTWFDQCENENLIQETKGDQPKIANATAIIKSNGNPAIRNNDTNYLHTSYNSTTILDQPSTVFVVLKSQNIENAYRGLFQEIREGYTYHIGMACSTYGSLEILSDYCPTGASNQERSWFATPKALNTMYQQTHMWDGSKIQGWQDGVAGTSKASSESFGSVETRLEAFTLAQGMYMTGCILEILLYTVALNSTIRSAEEKRQKKIYID